MCGFIVLFCFGSGFGCHVDWMGLLEFSEGQGFL